MSRADSFELVSFYSSLDLPTEPDEVLSSPPAPMIVKADTINELYSSESFTELMFYFFSTFGGTSTALDLVIAPVVYGGLKLCPASTQKTILNKLSTFRSGVKSMLAALKTMFLAGVSAAGSRVGLGVGAVAGVAVGAINAGYLEPETKQLEEQLARKNQLNKLLLEHLENGDGQIPQGLSDIQLISWFEDKSQFADLPRDKIKEINFRMYTSAEAERLMRLKMLVRLIGGVYGLSVINSILGGLQIARYMSDHVSLILNAVLGPLLIANHYQIAHYQVQDLLLNVEHSYLQGKLAVQQKNLREDPTSAVAEALVESQYNNTKGVVKALLQPPTCQEIQIQQTTAQLKQCEEKKAEHAKININNNLIFEAVVKGFLEGVESVGCAAGPLLFFGLVCWQLAVAIVVVAAVVGTVRAVQRGMQMQKELEKPAGAANTPKPEIELYSRNIGATKPPQPAYPRPNKISSNSSSWFSRSKPKQSNRPAPEMAIKSSL